MNTRQFETRALGGAAWLNRGINRQPIWGQGNEILWSSGEPLLIAAPTGVGKTTIAQTLILAMIRCGSSTVLGYPVTATERPILYVAADRPQQARRSLSRMVGTADYGRLDAMLRVPEGLLSLTDERNPITELAMNEGCGTVVIDSLKDVAVDLSKEETGSRVAKALQTMMHVEIEVLVLHHERKKSDSERRVTRQIDDIYGSTWITAVAGSVLYLQGKPGDPVVALRQLKAPAEQVEPIQLTIQFESGTIEPTVDSSPIERLEAFGRPATAREYAAKHIAESNQEVTAAEKEKARRILEKLVKQGLAASEYVAPSDGGSHEKRYTSALSAEDSASVSPHGSAHGR